MPIFELQDPSTGKTFEVEAPNVEAAVGAFKQFSSAPQKPDVSGLESFGRGALQGATFGFSDEIYGAGAGAVDWLRGEGFNYSKNRDEVRAANERAREANPGTYIAGEVGGGLALPFGAAGVAARSGAIGRGLMRATGIAPEAMAPTLGARAVLGASQGARMGATHGLGHSNADLTEQDVLGAAGDVAGGAITGGVLGGALTPAIDLGAAVLRGVTNPIRGYVSPQGMAAQKYAENAARDVGASATPQEIARGVAVTNARAARAARIDPQTRMMDVGGENTKGLMRQAYDMPNDRSESVRQMLDRRQMRQWRDIERGLARTLGDPDAYATSVGDVIARRGQQAAADFQRAFSVETPMTPALRSVFERPTMQELQRLTARRLADEGRAIGLENRTQQIHRMKMELDNQIGAARRAQQTGQRPQAGWDLRTLQGLKRDLLAAVDNPAYRRALDNFAGESALINAAEDGFENALRMHTEEIVPLLRGMTAGEQAMWRTGAARALAGKIRQGDRNRDRTKSVFSSPDIRLRINAIWPDRASAREFTRLLDVKGQQAETRRLLQGNSKTSANLARASEAGEPLRATVDAANATGQALSGRLAPMLAFMSRMGNRFSGITPPTANALLEIGARPAAQGLDPTVIAALNQYARAPGQRSQVARGVTAGLLGPLIEDDVPLRGGIGPRYREGLLTP
jgi:hypothetical protein